MTEKVSLGASSLVKPGTWTDVTPARMSEFHAAYQTAMQSMISKINLSTPIHLGEMGTDFDRSGVVRQYDDGQQVSFTYQGLEYRGVVSNGKIKAWPVNDISLL